MKNGLIIVNGFWENESTRHQVRSLTEEFSARGVTMELKKGNELPVLLDGGNAVSRIGSPDFVIYLDKDIHTAELLEKTGIPLFNSAETVRLCDDKMLTYVALSGHGIAIPKTISSPVMYRPVSDDFIQTVEREIEYPVVVKQVYGSMGKSVYLARTREELTAIREKLKLLPHLYQRHVGASHGLDIRVIVIGGKAVASMRRENPSDFRSNVELGGVGTKCALTDAQRTLAERAAAILGADYCGVDLIPSDEGDYLCEVNSNAFFLGITRATGVNVAGLYADYVMKKLNGIGEK